MLGFSPLAGAPLASTGDASQSVTVSINADSGIVRSSNNLSTPMLRGAVGFLPEETLFEVVVNGRILGDIDNSGSFNSNDASNAFQWEAGTSSAAATAYIEGPMTTYMLANLAAYEGINIAFSSVAMSGVVGTGVTVETDQTVDVNNRLQIAQVPDNLAPAIGAAVGNQPPNVTLFNTVVNGRILGDINGNGVFNGSDTFAASKWDNDNATLPLADARYISGPMNDYMIANFSSFGPAGIGLIFNSPTGVGTVGTGVTVETDQTVDVDNVGITATGVVGTGTTIETDQTVDVNNRQEIARTTSNLSTPIARATLDIEPEKTLFEVDVNGRKLGDIDNNGSVTTFDSIAAGQWEAGTSSAAITAYIEGPMNTYMLGNINAYEGISINFTTLDPTGVVGTGVTVETDQTVDVNNIGITATGVVDVDGVDVETDQTVDVDNIGITATGVVDVDGVDVETDQVIDVDNLGITATGVVDDVTIVEGAGVTVSLDNEDITATGVVDDVDVETDHVIDVNNLGITATGVVDDVDVETGHVIDVNNIGITATGVVDADGVDVETDQIIDVNNVGITATGVVEKVLVWSAIIPEQTANFILISPSQTSGFGPVSPSQTSGFTSVIPSQTSGFTPVVPSQSSTWVEIVL